LVDNGVVDVDLVEGVTIFAGGLDVGTTDGWDTAVPRRREPRAEAAVLSVSR